MKEIRLGNTTVGLNHPPYYIADIAANHDGSLEQAYRLIELAKEAGAHAAKFQNFSAGKIVSRFGFDNLAGGKLSHQAQWKSSVFEVYEKYSIEKDWTARLKEKCDAVGIEYFSSPYDIESVDAIDQYVSIYKIGSGDITWLDIIRYIASRNKPVIIASGASELGDVDRAIDCIRPLNSEIVLMQCNTNYTASRENFSYVNLNVLKEYATRYPDLVLGLSDHTPGHATVLGSIALGARVIEKHFTDDNSKEGPDHKFAMNPKTWREMVENGNDLYAALGDGVKRTEPNEKDASIVQRRSISAKSDLSAGTVLTEENIQYLRPKPADGFAPYEKELVLGQTLASDVKAGQHFTKKNFT